MLVYNIERLCEEHGVSVSKLEQTLGISLGTIRSWKTRSPTLKNLQKVADHFHVSLDKLTGCQDQDQRPA